MVLRSFLYLQSLQFFIIICLADDADFVFPVELQEGSQCIVNGDNEKGICRNVTECPKILKDISKGFFSNDHCRLFGSKELVCCPPPTINDQFDLRPADVVSVCQQIENESRFSGGFVSGASGNRESIDGQFPFIVSLGYPDEKDKNITKYNCGGSLISAVHVLTAAHCIVNFNSQVPVEVRMGSIDLDTNSEAVQRIPIANLYPHPSFRINAHYFDIAIIRLRYPARITATVKPVCLYTNPISNDETVNGTLIAAGYSITQFGRASPQKKLKSFGLRLVSKSECDMAFNGVRKLRFGIDENSMLCGKDIDEMRGFDVCQGDSGGPMLLRNSLAGIISFGAGCIGIAPTVYTIIYPFLDWIQTTTNQIQN